MSNILITGGAGFIGSHLCGRLLEEGNNVVCLDNFMTGAASNIRHLVSNSRFRVIDHDVISPISIETDEIYNLACPASPKYYQHDPIQTIKTSIYGAINMLDLAKRYDAKILQASTSEVYGNPELHPQSEDYWGRTNPVGPRACYDEGKRCAETLFFDYHRQHAINVKVVRIFNTYGPGMQPSDGRVVSNFIIQALCNRDITIYGSGLQTRSFCYIDDLIEGLLQLMATDSTLSGPINLGNSSEITIVALAEKIIERTGSRSKIVFHALPIDDPVRRCPDISLAQEKLEWKPDIVLDEGLKRTIAYFERRLLTSK